MPPPFPQKGELIESMNCATQLYNICWLSYQPQSLLQDPLSLIIAWLHHLACKEIWMEVSNESIQAVSQVSFAKLQIKKVRVFHLQGRKD